MRRIYREIISSKTGFKIPVLANGRTIESRYNPETDIERKIETIKKDDLFYLVIGLGSGLLVSKLLEKNQSAIFLIIENSSDDIEFLKSLPEAKKIIDSERRAHICVKEDLESALPSFYVPALHGNLNIIEQANYLSDELETKDFIKSKIDSALKNIMADFSVQAHFGKIWQRNIMQNLMQHRLTGDIILPTEKKAAVLAAGPTLDSYLEKIISDRESYYVVSTDTAYSAASKRGIICDAVVSIDGQLVSENHFLHKISNKTLFIFDLCGNSSAVKKILRYTSNILFFETGHPLAKFASKNNDAKKQRFLNLFSGSGTVAITALDFAIKAGFSEIELGGADFSYIGGRPYAKGTYLDSLYNKDSSRIFTSETSFSSLMYRTELIQKTENIVTTEVLQSYKKSLEEYLEKNSINFKRENNIYYISTKTKHPEQTSFEESFKIDNALPFSYSDFYKSIRAFYKSADLLKINFTDPAGNFQQGLSPLIISVLPYIAFLRLSTKNVTLDEFVKLALTNLLRYNISYEK